MIDKEERCYHFTETEYRELCTKQRFIGFKEFAMELYHRMGILYTEREYATQNLDIPDEDENPVEYEKWEKEQSRRICTHAGLSDDDPVYDEGAHYGIRRCNQILEELVKAEVELYKGALDNEK
jgi:hypothetical protein